MAKKNSLLFPVKLNPVRDFSLVQKYIINVYHTHIPKIYFAHSLHTETPIEFEGRPA